MKFLAIVLLLVSFGASATGLDNLTDHNYCGPPKRDAMGRIARDPAVTRAFQEIHPCPVTLRKTGACPNWFKDHVRPLACGGCDSVSNMQWLDLTAKRIKDSYERRIYGMGYADTGACVNEVTK